jgi:tRNA threonylcarbamoyladenosine biosynthesis protein TsaE
MTEFDHHVVPDAADFPYSLKVHGFEETMALGEKVAGLLKGGEIILLHGELGAGKTCFVQGVCLGLGVTEAVVSPTFTLVNTYGGPLVVHHLDFYRVGAGDSLDDIGVPDILDEVWDGKAVVLVEWPTPLLPELGNEPRFELLAVNGGDEDCRTWFMRGDGVNLSEWVGLLK